jgi:hypothetical protein
LLTINLDKVALPHGRERARPSASAGVLTGHHEILLPLLHAVVAAKLAASHSRPPLTRRPPDFRFAASLWRRSWRPRL